MLAHEYARTVLLVIFAPIWLPVLAAIVVVGLAFYL
jgi:hypothetical protein